MSSEQLQYEKKSLINWINQIDDVFIIEQIKNVRNKSIEIPEWQKEEVLRRIKTSKPEDYIPWEDAMKEIKKSL